MPNISAHMVVAKRVGEKLNIYNDDFIIGNIIPDIMENESSHYKVQDEIYFIPNIECFLEKFDISKPFYLGYLVHLLLDKHFLKDYLISLYPDVNIFLDGEIYKDYDYLNSKIVSKSKLDVEFLEEVLTNINERKYHCKIKNEKLKYNIECLKQKKEGTTKYLEFDSFFEFLLNVSNQISEEIKEYASKYC